MTEPPTVVTPAPPQVPSGPSFRTRVKAWFSCPLVQWAHRLYMMVEGVTVMGLGFGVFYVGYWLLLGPVSDPRYHRTLLALQAINDAWKVGLLVLVLLFYRTIRAFLDRAIKGPWGIEAPIQQSPPVNVQNPPQQPPQVGS